MHYSHLIDGTKHTKNPCERELKAKKKKKKGGRKAKQKCLGDPWNTATLAGVDGRGHRRGSGEGNVTSHLH